MNFLKKTLGRDQPKRQQKGGKGPNTTLPLRKNKPIWSNIDELIENRADKKTKLQSFEEVLLRVFRQFDQSRKLLGETEFKETLGLLLAEYRSYYSNKQSATMPVTRQDEEVMAELAEKLQALLKSDRDLGNKNLILLFTEKLRKHLRHINREEKDRKLEQFDKMVSFMTMKKKPAKGVDESNSRDFIVKVTKEQYTIESKNRLKSKKKSLGTLNSGSVSGSSNYRRNSLTKKGSEGDINHARLHSLLKDASLKVVKTSVKYDYSAILQGSFANIQRRNNITVNPQPAKESKPIEKVKKNEGFVFFRPQKKF